MRNFFFFILPDFGPLDPNLGESQQIGDICTYLYHGRCVHKHIHFPLFFVRRCTLYDPYPKDELLSNVHSNNIKLLSLETRTITNVEETKF